MFGITVTDPVTITEFEPPHRYAISHDGTFKGHGLITLEAGADGTTTIVRWDEVLIPPVLAHLGALVDDPGPRPPSSRPTSSGSRSSSRRVPRATERGTRAAPPRRRDLRAVPGALRPAPAGPRARRHPAVGRLGPVRPAAVPPARGGRDARRLRHGPGHRVVPQRPVRRATSRRPGCRPSCSPSSRSPRPPSRRSGSSCGRWSSSRPTTRSRPRPCRFGEDPTVERILVCTPDKDMAQLVRDDRIVLWDRRRNLIYDDAGVRAKWGVPPTLDPGLARPRRRHLGRLPGAAGLGRQVRRGGPDPLRPLRGDPAQGVGLGGARGRRLARDGAGGDAARPLGRGAAVPRPGPPPDRRRRRRRSASATPTSCAGTARRAPSGRRSARRWGLDRLRARPHRWLDETRLVSRGPSGRARAAPRGAPAARRRCRSSRVSRPRSNHGPPVIEVTVAPPRSAMSPAAATSQADSPPCWTNASNRPFAT